MFHVEHWAVLHGVTKIYEEDEVKCHVEHCARRSVSPTFQIITACIVPNKDVMSARLPLLLVWFCCAFPDENNAACRGWDWGGVGPCELF